MFIFKNKEQRLLDDLLNFISQVSKLIFKISVITFVVYFSAEQFKIGLISNYFDLNLLLIIALTSLILVLLLPTPAKAGAAKRASRAKQWFDYLVLLILASLLGLIIFQRLLTLQLMALLIALFSFLAIFLIFTLNLSKDD